MDKYKKNFNLFDRNMDSLINFSELKELLISIGLLRLFKD